MSDAHEDTPEYLEQWAGKLAAELPADELGRLARQYDRIGRDSGVPEEDRKAARKRSRAIRKKMK